MMVYGEDYDNDGWVEETKGDRRRFDFVGNNKDLMTMVICI